MKSFKFLAMTIMISSLLAFAAACGNGESKEGNGSEAGTSEEAAQLEGEVGIDGSSTVAPIGEAVSEEFAMDNKDVKAPIGVSGTGGGFEKFVAGETDISQASRPIKDEEAQAAKEAGIEYTELQVAFDGLSVVVNKENDFIKELTVEDLKKIWVEDGKEKKWSDINPKWPDETIKLFSPGTDSGTYDYFNEVILEDEAVAKQATLSEDDNVLVKGVQSDKTAMGFFGYAYYLENKDTLKVVPIVNEEGKAVEPTNETVESGDYNPLSRPLYIYVNNAAMKEKPQVAEYVKFYMENAGALAEEVGYVSLPEDKYKEQLETIEGLK
ncbi:PstS family phosphate ABC transporter substrate-binding protein [Metabacillus idriensis]|uniref:Phosphate-binding protein n=1 Tax=Metabacillus idriensis TaxID=324768 RepID=A0A6I2ME44_9BACI|nr:PstS family phosphate ABC transporter substrate-binding protein [Metabacillus idriensis]MCM3596237.1 PstS family phosphate ABC transporter substrate-binding protein [Metabacillus idriensis]MRX55999.1 phosphate ABC transporter substrate-binding protein PstS family protein [Metabacillus idriensis]OHR73947.1 phosphate-binding protein [Bacillus sp. HMSC76G11]